MNKLALVLMLLVFTGCTSFLDSAGSYYPHCYPNYCSSPKATSCACGRCKLSGQKFNSPESSQSYVNRQEQPRRKTIKRTIREEYYNVQDGRGGVTRRINRFTY